MIWKQQQPAGGSADAGGSEAHRASDPICRDARGRLHDPAVWCVAVIGALLVFAHEMATQIMLEYIGFEYGLSASALKLFAYVIYAIVGVGQLVIALLTDHYFGVVRSLRMALLFTFMALAGLTATVSNETPQLNYAGQNYEVRIIHTTRVPASYVMIEGQPKAFVISDDGYFHIKDHQDQNLPAHLAPGSWDLHMGHGAAGKILIIFPMAMLVLARCFGIAIIFSAMARLYRERHAVRPVGMLMTGAFLNFGFVLWQLVQIYVEPQMGRKAILLLADVVILGAFWWVRTNAHIRRVPGKVQKGASALLRKRAYMMMVFVFMLVTLGLVGTLLNTVPAVQAGKGAPLNYAALMKTMSYMLMVIWLTIAGGALLYSYICEKRALFYASLSTLVIAIIGLSFWSGIALGQNYLNALSAAHVTWGNLSAGNFFLVNDIMINPSLIFIVGCCFIALWPKYQHMLPDLTVVQRIVAAMLLTSLCYFLLSWGAHHGDAAGQMHWPYYALAAFGLPMAEILYTPIIASLTFYLWRHSRPTAALAFLACTNSLRPMLTLQIERGTDLHKISAMDLGPGVAGLAHLGQAFVILGGIAMLAAALTMALWGPLLMRMARAHLHARAQDGDVR